MKGSATDENDCRQKGVQIKWTKDINKLLLAQLINVSDCSQCQRHKAKRVNAVVGGPIRSERWR